VGKSSGSGSSTTVQKADPWVGQQPALGALYNGALQQFSSGGPTYYPNSTVAPLSPVTQQAQNKLYSRAVSGNPLNSVAQGQAMRTLNDQYLYSTPGRGWLNSIANGGMLNSNPYTDTMFGNAADAVSKQFRNAVMPGITSQYAGAGRFGSNAMNTAMDTAQENYGQTLNKLASDIYGQNYNQERVLQNQALGELGTQFGRERTLQMGALGSAPGLANQDYADIQQLAGLGQQMDTRNQGLLDADINRFNYYQQLPEHQLAFLNQTVNGGYPGGSSSSTGTSKEKGSAAAGALGGGLLGYSMGTPIASMLGATLPGAGAVVAPWAALGGAVLGGLLS
jgi:hypothetical protein